MTIILLFYFGTSLTSSTIISIVFMNTLNVISLLLYHIIKFVELEQSVFFRIVFFLKLFAFGRCTDISFVDRTMIPVCHNLRV